MSFLHRLPHGISVVDTGFQRQELAAAYLVVEDGRAAFIDTGPNSAVPRLLAALTHAGLAPDAVDWLIVTHVHLDHAGGAGALLRQLPRARLVVHPRGARHLVEPARLMAGVRAVYGDEVAARDYGELVPVPPQRVLTSDDGMVLHLGARPLRFFDTPGHARHHHCIWDEASRGWFAGDTLGIAYPEFRTPGGHYALPSTTPTQFDPPALQRTVARLLDVGPEVAYLTHYGAVGGLAAHAEMVLRQADRMVELARAVLGAADGPARLRRELGELYLEELRAAGVVLPTARCRELLALDIELNAQGLEALQREGGLDG